MFETGRRVVQPGLAVGFRVNAGVEDIWRSVNISYAYRVSAVDAQLLTLRC